MTFLINRTLLLVAISFLIAIPVTAQMPVHEEPYHQPVWQNEVFRLLEVFVPPGDTTAFHRHEHPICYIVLKGSKLFLQQPTQNGRTVTLPTGYAGTQGGSIDTPFIHRFANVGTQEVQIYALERLIPGTKPTADSANLVFQQRGFTLYKFSVQPKSTIDVPYGMLIVAGPPGNVFIKQQRRRKRLKRVWFPVNPQNGPAQLVSKKKSAVVYVIR
ncbi:MAG: hypothetical protein AAGI38_00070 [Bacteroidota bacterium]